MHMMANFLATMQWLTRFEFFAKLKKNSLYLICTLVAFFRRVCTRCRHAIPTMFGAYEISRRRLPADLLRYPH